MPNLPGSATDLADHLLATDPYLATLAERLWREQRRLKRAVGGEAFRVYLRIEELTNERLIALVERVWAIARAQERLGGDIRRGIGEQVKGFEKVVDPEQGDEHAGTDAWLAGLCVADGAGAGADLPGYLFNGEVAGQAGSLEAQAQVPDGGGYREGGRGG